MQPKPKGWFHTIKRNNKFKIIIEDILEETITQDVNELEVLEKEPIRSRTTRKKEKVELEENEDLFDMIDTMYEEEK